MSRCTCNSFCAKPKFLEPSKCFCCGKRIVKRSFTNRELFWMTGAVFFFTLSMFLAQGLRHDTCIDHGRPTNDNHEWVV